MTIGVGGSDMATELQTMRSMRGDMQPIGNEEREARIAKAQEMMRQQGIAALYLDASTSLYYFTGLRAGGRERLHGAVIPAEGALSYICPAFEVEKTAASIVMPGDIRGWEEHEDPTALVIDTVDAHASSGTLAVDETTPFFTFDGLRKAGNRYDFVNGSDITGACRMIKSKTEIALMTRAKQITLEVQKAAARILTPGITTAEVKAFIAQAHQALGAGRADGVLHRAVRRGDSLSAWRAARADARRGRHGADRYRRNGRGLSLRHHPQLRVRRPDTAATPDLGPGVDRPGGGVQRGATGSSLRGCRHGRARRHQSSRLRPRLRGPRPAAPHRPRHRAGVHEWTYLVKGNQTPLAPGMCFSNEPMICIYGEFGVRLEDHFYMTEDGPEWFTQPCPSADYPFGYETAA